MNIFDLVVVIVGFVELFWGIATSLNSTGSAVSAFRSFRLFRIFKLASSWVSLRELLKTMYKTFFDIINFSVILTLFVIITALIGREVFAYRVRYWIGTDEPYTGPLDDGIALSSTESPRANFDTLGESLITIFIFLTSENWSAILRDFTRVKGFALPILFMIPTLIAGNYILLNLFIAILLSNFKKSRLEKNDALSKAPEVGRLHAFLKRFQEALEVFAVFLSMRKQLEKKFGPAIIEDSAKQKKEEARKELRKGEKNNELFPEHIKPSPQLIRRRLRLVRQRENLLKKLEEKWGVFNEMDKTGMLEILGKEEVYKKQEPEGFAFYFWKPTNKVRRLLVKTVTHPIYDIAITIIILLSGVVLAIDLPLRDPDSGFMKFVYYADLVISILFVIEFIMKVIALGFLLNGKRSYLRSGWNILDFLVVLFFFFSFAFNDIFGKAKIFRTIRVLRPLRIVSKSQELQIVINCLLRSIKGIISVVLVCFIFFFIFGTFGTNYFKGSFFDCDMSQIDSQFHGAIQTKWECLDYGGDWVNSIQNFDNIFKAMAILFQVATTEGWIEVMHQGIDAVGPNFVPVLNYNLPWAIFFISFIIISTFFVLNLFAGIIVDSFNREKNTIRGYFLLTKQQTAWVNIQIYLLSTTPDKANKPPNQNWRKPIYSLVLSKPFEIAIMCFIVFNTAIFLFYFNRAPDGFKTTLDVLNTIMIGIFTIECILKITALDLDYFKSRWNLFDLGVIVCSIIGLILDISGVYNLRTTISVLRSIRVISFIRLVKQAKGTRMIINTFLITLPSLFNVGALLFLILYVFSIIGMSMFPYIKYGEGITRNANFHHFGISFITLLRISTGEDWHLIQSDCLRFLKPNNICFDISDFEGYSLYGLMGCGLNEAYIFFISFIIIFTLVLLNLFVAIILEAFSETSKNEDSLIPPAEILNFKKEWAKFDPEGTSMIPMTKLLPFLRMIPPPLGPVKEIFYSPVTKVEFLNRLRIPIYYTLTSQEKCFHYYDVLLALTNLVMETNLNFTGKIQPYKKLNIHYMIEKERISKLHAVPHIYRTPFTSSHYMAILVLLRALKRLSRKRKERLSGNQQEKSGNQEEKKHEKREERLPIPTPQIKLKNSIDSSKEDDDKRNEKNVNAVIVKREEVVGETHDVVNEADETEIHGDHSMNNDDSMAGLISGIKEYSLNPSKDKMEEIFQFPNQIWHLDDSKEKKIPNSKSISQKTQGFFEREPPAETNNHKEANSKSKKGPLSSDSSQVENKSTKDKLPDPEKQKEGAQTNSAKVEPVPSQTESAPSQMKSSQNEHPEQETNSFLEKKEGPSEKEQKLKSEAVTNKKEEKIQDAQSNESHSTQKNNFTEDKPKKEEENKQHAPIFESGPPPVPMKPVISQIDSVTLPLPQLSMIQGGRISQPYMKRETTEDKRLDKRMRMVKNSGKIVVNFIPGRDETRLAHEEAATMELLQKKDQMKEEKPKMNEEEAQMAVRSLMESKKEPNDKNQIRLMSKKKLKPNSSQLQSKELLANRIQVVRDPFGALERGEYPEDDD